MLLNPHPPLGGSATKTGDAGTEDVINRASGPGVPDGRWKRSPPTEPFSEDDNENGYLDNFGPGNMGLGFYGTIASPGTATTSGKNQNTQINSGTSPNPFGADAAGDTTIELPVAARRHERTGSAGPATYCDWWMGRWATCPQNGLWCDSG